MNAVVLKITYGQIGRVIFAVGLSLFMGCSQETASKPQAATAPQKVETKKEPSKAIPAKPSQTSSLEALQKGTLGKGG